MTTIRFGSVSLARSAVDSRESWRGHLRCRFKRAILFLCAGLVLAGAAAAQDYPTRPILVIVPFPAGGSTDILARILAESMRATLGQTMVVQNVPGAGSTIGVGRAIQSTPDGYTLSIGNWTSHVGASAVYRVPWNVLTDLEPVAMLSIRHSLSSGGADCR